MDLWARAADGEEGADGGWGLSASGLVAKVAPRSEPLVSLDSRPRPRRRKLSNREPCTPPTAGSQTRARPPARPPARAHARSIASKQSGASALTLEARAHTSAHV